MRARPIALNQPPPLILLLLLLCRVSVLRVVNWFGPVHPLPLAAVNVRALAGRPPEAALAQRLVPAVGALSVLIHMYTYIHSIYSVVRPGARPQAPPALIIYAYICVHVYPYLSLYIYTYIHTCMCIHVYVHTDIYRCLCVCMYVYTWTCMYTFIHSYRHVHICTWWKTASNTSAVPRASVRFSPWKSLSPEIAFSRSGLMKG